MGLLLELGVHPVKIMEAVVNTITAAERMVFLCHVCAGRRSAFLSRARCRACELRRVGTPEVRPDLDTRHGGTKGAVARMMAVDAFPFTPATIPRETLFGGPFSICCGVVGAWKTGVQSGGADSGGNAAASRALCGADGSGCVGHCRGA